MLAVAGCVCAKEQNLLFFYLTPEGFNLSCNSCVMMSVMTLEDFKILYLVLFKSFWLIKKKRKKEIETINLAICLSGEGSAHKLRGRTGTGGARIEGTQRGCSLSGASPLATPALSIWMERDALAFNGWHLLPSGSE